MSERKRKVFSAQQKAKVALEAIRGIKTVNEIAQQFGIHPSQVSQWKRELQEQAAGLFEGKRGPKSTVDPEGSSERLYSEIGRLKMELDWLKKKVGDIPVTTRREWINADESLSLVRQCSLAGVARSSIYANRYPSVLTDEEEHLLLREIDAEYTRHPFYGSRRMRVYLHNKGYKVNLKYSADASGKDCLLFSASASASASGQVMTQFTTVIQDSSSEKLSKLVTDPEETMPLLNMKRKGPISRKFE